VRLLTWELTGVLQSLNKPWELLFINDGSTDGSINVLKELRDQSPHIRVMSLKRNCGQTAAFDAEKIF
jgi:glycosyltransferase involved in cell wall biosynthesis